jgi:hypothetical protein
LWRKKGPWTASRHQVERDLKHLATFSHARVWGALGGEPLLNKRIVDIVQVARESGIADEYEVWTNGLLVAQMPHAFWDVIDRLVVSRYAGKLSDEQVERMQELANVYRKSLVIRDERSSPNFMTWLEKEPTDAVTTQAKYLTCAFRKGHNYAASYGYFFACCCGPHLPLLVQDRPFGSDGLLIESATEETLGAYLSSQAPFGACRDCAGRDTAVKIPWREERDPVIWLSKSAGKDGVVR